MHMLPCADLLLHAGLEAVGLLLVLLQSSVPLRLVEGLQPETQTNLQSEHEQNRGGGAPHLSSSCCSSSRCCSCCLLRDSSKLRRASSFSLCRRWQLCADAAEEDSADG